MIALDGGDVTGNFLLVLRLVETMKKGDFKRDEKDGSKCREELKILRAS